MAFNPPVAANVTVKAFLYFNSDSNNVTTMVSTGQATPGGIFGAAQGLKPLPLTAPGEYFATVLATYWDTQGTLWVSTMRHAGVVYPLDSSIEAHGKLFAWKSCRPWRKALGLHLPNGTSKLDHVLPLQRHDVLLKETRV
jgi:hypothetical protein